MSGGEAACQDYAAYLSVRALDVQTTALYIHTQALNIHTRVLYTQKRTLYIHKKALNIPSRQPGICDADYARRCRGAKLGVRTLYLQKKRCVNTIWPLRINLALEDTQGLSQGSFVDILCPNVGTSPVYPQGQRGIRGLRQKPTQIGPIFFFV